MTLDWIDQAFLAGGSSPRRSPTTVEQPEEPPQVDGPAAGAVVRRLLAAASEAWDALADAAAGSARNGRPVIAVTGSAPGEGRSTVATGLLTTLRGRGISAVVVSKAPILMRAAEASAARGASIVIVDAGPWFTPGPVRRAAVERSALGCDAAIFVRRESAPPSPARIACLSDIGLAVLGEVISFAHPCAA